MIMGTEVLSTGDKILNVMKDMDMGIPSLAALSGVRENTLLDIMAGIREADLATLCRIADALGVCVRCVRIRRGIRFQWKRIPLQS